jgi:endoglucanase
MIKFLWSRLICMLMLPLSFSYYTSRNHTIFYENKIEIKIKGINYFGFESDCHAPQGLWVHDLDYYLDFLKNNNFNAIRLPFSYETALHLDDPPKLECLTQIQDQHCKSSIGNMLECFFIKAKKRNIFILLDFHTINGIITETPYGNLQQHDFLYAWDLILERFIDYPNLLGLDIKNEPHGSLSWNEWSDIVNNFINHVQQRFPTYNGLFFVEGVEMKSCWGGSFQDIKKKNTFIQHIKQHKIVFSPHVYGVSVTGEKTFIGRFDQFESWFGFLHKIYDSAIIIVEAGGHYNTLQDIEWHERYAEYLKNIQQTSNFYFCLNPNSLDTGGLLNDDWTTPNNHKLKFLSNLQPKPSWIKLK